MPVRKALWQQGVHPTTFQHPRGRDRRCDAGDGGPLSGSGLTPKWVDGTTVGSSSFMIHVHHAAAAIESGLCRTVLITHGESDSSHVGRTRNVVAPTSLAGQFEQPYGANGIADFVHDLGAALRGG